VKADVDKVVDVGVIILLLRFTLEVHAGAGAELRLFKTLKTAAYLFFFFFLII
jgi:hypothetical protein